MKRWLLVAVVLVAGMGAEMVPTPGSRVTYPARAEHNAGGRSVPLVLTGTAVRTKALFNVYAIGSYVQEGVKVRSAEDLVAASCVKRLHLVMERAVSGRDLAEAFRVAIRMNHPEPAFEADLASLVEAMRAHSVQRGDHIFLTFVPDFGLHAQVAGKAEFVIRNTGFARAVWEIYLGTNNLGEAIKRGLVSRL